MEALQDDADASTPRPRQPIFVQWAIVDPRDEHVSPTGALQPRQDRHQRRFSRTRWSQEGQRSEERRVGKEWVSTGRCGWETEDEKKQKKTTKKEKETKK